MKLLRQLLNQLNVVFYTNNKEKQGFPNSYKSCNKRKEGSGNKGRKE
uniref:Uncharacterized protein n=1 Tax=Meloidogyne enterolobii TaxID=390850 RepID=A0A6V7UUY3_MELEN|nr:unnamed protein product [Meloidogyne enterolobii]